MSRHRRRHRRGHKFAQSVPAQSGNGSSTSEQNNDTSQQSAQSAQTGTGH
jgi:hypothetical protein